MDAAVEGLHGLGPVEMNHDVELARQVGPEVVAGPFRLGLVNDADGPLKSGRRE